MPRVCAICGKKPLAGRTIVRSGLAKKKGGVLKGITNHAWDALAVCVYICETVYDYNKDDWWV